MNLKSTLLWIDCIGAALVGVAVLLLSGWLSILYQLPQAFVIFMGAVNLLYGSFSFSLAIRNRRPPGLIKVLVAGNIIWGVACFVWLFLFRHEASYFGYVQFVAEGIYVGSLGILEWRWREFLLTR